MINRTLTRNLRECWVFSMTLMFVFSLSVLAQEAPPQVELQVPESDRTVPYVPTPPEVVEKMLDLAKVGPSDVVYDLGSGDGRIVIMAAEKFGAHSIGVELDEERFKESSAHIAKLGLENRAKIVRGNLFETDLHPATVVTIYLLPSVNERLRPRLEKELRPGARVVSHNFLVEGWKAEQVVKVSPKDSMEHTIYLYSLPQAQAAHGEEKSQGSEQEK